MKSIVEEASSVSKAIEKGWTRAGKPRDFTVKIYEEAEKNFFGFTTKSAKVGIFFEETSFAPTQRLQKERPPQRKLTQPQTQPQAQPSTQSSRQVNNNRPERQTMTPPQRNERVETPVHRKESSPWNADLVSSTQEWVTDSLAIMGKSDIAVKTDVNNFALKLTFARPILEINEKEKLLFKSWAYLIMQSLRQKYKRPLKGLKVILTSE